MPDDSDGEYSDDRRRSRPRFSVRRREYRLFRVENRPFDRFEPRNGGRTSTVGERLERENGGRDGGDRRT